MAVKIRFSRIGKKHAPIYRIVAVDSRKKRDGKNLENLGTYNPMTKEIVQFHDDRVAYWVSVGAIITDSVQRLIKIREKSGAYIDTKKTAAKATDKKDSAAVEKKSAVKTTKKVDSAKTTEKKVATKAAPKKDATAKKEKGSK